MNLFRFIEQLESADPGTADLAGPRRSAIKSITGLASKMIFAAIPVTLAALPRKAAGADMQQDVNNVLNFALKLELLQSGFYDQGIVTQGLIPGNDLSFFIKIKADQDAHIAFLRSVLGNLAEAAPEFDFTAGGTFPAVLSDYPTFLAVSNVLEDIGLRTYKGQLPIFMQNKTLLTAALGIHAAEARHASVVRYLRAAHGIDIKPWIAGTVTEANDTGIGAVADADYAGENNVLQNGADVTKLASINASTTPYAIASEAFDEPVDLSTALGLVRPFIK